MKIETVEIAVLAWLAMAGVACDGDKADGTAASGCEQDTGEVGAAVPIAIDCSFVFAGVQTDVSYGTDGGAGEVAVGGKLIASGALDDSEYEGRAFSMTIYAEDSTVLSHALYQMDRTRLPVNEFFGDHGFTGLNWVKDPDAQENVQFACFARDPSAPVHAWQE